MFISGVKILYPVVALDSIKDGHGFQIGRWKVKFMYLKTAFF